VCDEFLSSENGAVLCLLRLHHAIGDGISLFTAFSRIFALADGTPWTMSAAVSSRTTTAAAAAGGGTANTSTLPVASTPTPPGVLTQVTRTVSALGKVLALPVSAADTPTCIATPTQPFVWTNQRQTVTVPPISLARIKAIKNRVACTVNDVMVALVAGCWRRYLCFRNDPAVRSGQPILMRALIPVAFPRKDDPNDADGLKNKWCFVSLALPISATEPLTRLTTAKLSMDALKASPEAYLQLKLNEFAAAALPTATSAQTIFDIMAKHSMVFTNVCMWHSMQNTNSYTHTQHTTIKNPQTHLHT
jgi:hypothetical protein